MSLSGYTSRIARLTNIFWRSPSSPQNGYRSLSSTTTATTPSPASPHPLDGTDPRHNQTFTLSDGRSLGFAEYGDPAGYPLLFFHGFPSSRLEGLPIDGVAKRRNIRVIVPDRPGYGLSSFRPPNTTSSSFKPRRIIDWPSDVRALSDHLNISRFAILGGSGGGPFALACAHQLPREMLSAVGLMAPAGPWHTNPTIKDGKIIQPSTKLTQETLLSAKFASFIAHNFPTLTRIIFDGLVSLARTIAGTSTAQTSLNNLLIEAAKKRNDVENEMCSQITIDQQREQMLKIIFEAFTQGAETMVYEADILTHDWGFRFEEVEFEGIRIWHGTKDRNAPIRQIRYMAETLPSCRLTEFADDNHFALAGKIEDILTEIVPEIESKSKEDKL